ncbi:MAG: TIGR04086 family membrane protein [Firmicutes bacterium]|nr:TIGR04086 family membrane protein [Bacillota bacterium]
MNTKTKGQDRFSLKVLKSIGFSYIITIIFFIIFALILTYTSIPDKYLPIMNSITMILSIALGSIYMGIKADNKGWLNGALVGILYMVILTIISLIMVKSFDLDLYLMLKYLISIITGAIGGMIGVNLK